MSRRYDTRTTIFSPEGRLFQVEYAMEAIGHAGTCLGILGKDGVLLAAERRNTNKLLDDVFSDKIYKLDENTACSVAGITSDANVLTQQLRLTAQRYALIFNIKARGKVQGQKLDFLYLFKVKSSTLEGIIATTMNFRFSTPNGSQVNVLT